MSLLLLCSHSPRDDQSNAPPEFEDSFLDPVARKLVNANLGLKLNQGSRFSCSKEFSQQITSDCLKATKVNMSAKKIKTEF